MEIVCAGVGLRDDNKEFGLTCGSRREMAKKKNPFVFLDVSIDGDPYERMFQRQQKIFVPYVQVIQLAIVGLLRVYFLRQR
ncbi:Peptidyl-prolyl cis-trans isomerase CYP95 [Bienertia sinuspersici]